MGPSHTDTEQRLRKKLNPMVQETACVGSPLDFFKKVPGTIFGSSILFNHLYLDMIAYIHKHLLKRHTSRCQEQIQDVGFLLGLPNPGFIFAKVSLPMGGLNRSEKDEKTLSFWRFFGKAG